MWLSAQLTSNKRQVTFIIIAIDRVVSDVFDVYWISKTREESK